MVMIELNQSRIIGDFLELNAEIAYNETTAKGIKKLFVKSKANKYRKRIIDLLSDFVKSDYILTRDNLYEAFVYFHDSRDIYTPKYLKVFKPDNKEDDMSSRIEGVINYKNILCLIHLDSERQDFEIRAQYNEKPNGEFIKISITRTELKNDIMLKDELAKINTYLKAEIADYIVSQINLFMEDK